MPKFPQRIFVTIEQPNNDDPYFVVHTDEQAAIEAVGNGGKVAVFDFDHMREAEITLKFKSK